MRFVTPVALAVILLWVPVDGVAQTECLAEECLVGITEVSVSVSLDELSSAPLLESDAEFLVAAERALELGLLKAGLAVGSLEEDAALIVECQFYVSGNDAGEGIWSWRTGLTVYALTPELDTVSPAIIWDVIGLGRGRIDDVYGKDVGTMCAEDFELEWRRVNNKPRMGTG
jgi:hypothetical protein